MFSQIFGYVSLFSTPTLFKQFKTITIRLAAQFPENAVLQPYVWRSFEFSKLNAIFKKL